MARILLGVTGGIAAYKACEVLRLLMKEGHDVVPLVTPGAERFVSAETFAALARRPASEDLYPHLTSADLLLVAPLSANTLAKLAHGLADTVLTEAALAHPGPVLVAPAMNARMWRHPATQANADVLRARGVAFAGPAEGELAEGEWGAGRMAEPVEIVARARELVGLDGSLAGKRVLVTAGGTREPLDAVRFLGNRSSGRMGLALAAEARRRGGEVTVLAANVVGASPPGVRVIETPSAEDMLREALARGPAADLILMAAAVADYRPAETRAGKRPKDAASWAITLEPTTDILQTLGTRRGDGQVLVGFAAESGRNGAERAREKLARKGLDLVVVNDISRPGIGFDAEDNEVVLISRTGERHVGKAPKSEIARAILDEAARIAGAGERLPDPPPPA